MQTCFPNSDFFKISCNLEVNQILKENFKWQQSFILVRSLKQNQNIPALKWALSKIQ